MYINRVCNYRNEFFFWFYNNSTFFKYINRFSNYRNKFFFENTSFFGNLVCISLIISAINFILVFGTIKLRHINRHIIPITNIISNISHFILFTTYFVNVLICSTSGIMKQIRKCSMFLSCH
jgi:hypothetical protein